MLLKDRITKKDLNRLYKMEKLSSPKIAEIYNCNPRYIRELLRGYNIRVRSKSEARNLLVGINIPKRKIAKMYLEQKKSSNQIAKELNCSPSLIRNRLKEFNIPTRKVKEALGLSNKPKYKRYDFSGDLVEKAYLIGFSKGDLHIERNTFRTIISSMNSSKEEQIELFQELFTKYSHVWTGLPGKENVVGTRAYLNNTFSFLLDLEDTIYDWILSDKDNFLGFLAGYIDAEGSFCLCGGDAVFSVRSQDKNILCLIREKLIELGVLLRPAQIARKKGTRDKFGTISNEDIWAIRVHRKDSLIKLMDMLDCHIKHIDKRRRMKILRKNIDFRNKKYNRCQGSKWDKLYLKEGIKI